MDNEEKYNDIREKLQKLEQIKAGDNFVNNLHYKIVELESEKRKEHLKKYDEARGGFLKNLFSNIQYPWLIPAVGFTVLIFFVFYITFLNRSGTKNNGEQISGISTDTLEQDKFEHHDQRKEMPGISQFDTNKISLKKNDNIEKNIAGNFKTEEKSESKLPPVKFSDKETDVNKLYKEKPIPVDSDDKIKSNEPFKDETKIISTDKSSEDRESKKEKMSSVNPETTTAPSEPEDGKLRGALSEDKSSKRLREKIDSVSKIDLEKLRQEILK